MRTVTLLGLVAIADAINMNWFTITSAVLIFYGLVLIAIATMLIRDLLNGYNDKYK